MKRAMLKIEVDLRGAFDSLEPRPYELVHNLKYIDQPTL